MFSYVLVAFSLLHCSNLVITLPSAPDETTLLRDLLDTSDYDVRVRPPANTATEITIGLSPKQIVRIVETSNEMEVLGDLRIHWEDQRLKFNGSNYGIESDTEVSIAAQNIWYPTIALTNSLSSHSLLDTSSSFVSFDSSGRVRMNFRHVFRFSCMLDITFYPYDKQNCNLLLNIEAYIKKHLVVAAIGVGMEQYEENTLWSLVSCESPPYNSLPDQSETIAFKFNMERKRTLHTLIDIIPPIVLTFLATTVSLVPVESGEKLSFAVSIFLTDAVYVTYIAGLTPRTASSTSYFLIYLIITLVMCAVSVFMAAIAIWMDDREEQGSILKKRCCLPRRVSATQKSPSGNGLTKRKTVARKMDFIWFIFHGGVALAITAGIFGFMTS